MCFLQTDTCREGWETAPKNGYLCFIKWVFVIVQLLSHVQLFVTLWTAAHEASLSFTVSQSLFKFKSIELLMPSNHLILCCSLLLLALSFPSIGVFPNDSAVRIKWPKYWSFSFSISLSNDYSWLISFRIDWSDLLAVWPSVNQRVRPGSHPSLIAI